jgi:hypothetical protein
VKRVFLLSPASTSGQRAGYLLEPRTPFRTAMALRTPTGAPLGDVFSFLSGLYFRGKLAYARTFGNPPRGLSGSYVITPCDGLVTPETCIRLDRLREYTGVRIDLNNPEYRDPLLRDVQALAARLRSNAEVVLLGSIASDKYVGLLTNVLGERLHFPIDFIGRGDMSRGGLLLRAAADREELRYAKVLGSVRRGVRPQRLSPRPGLQALLSRARRIRRKVR